MPACSLKVRLCCVNGGGWFPVQLCNVEFMLSEARMFKKGEPFRFSLLVPRSTVQGILKSKASASRLGWYVEAQLDIPNEIDMVRREPVALHVQPVVQAAQEQD